MLNDLRHALRTLARSPGFTLTAAFTLTLGIGLATVQFSLINAVMFKGLPFERSDRIMSVAMPNGPRDTIEPPVEAFQHIRRLQKSFSRLGGFEYTVGAIGGNGIAARRYSAFAVTANLFDLLGVRPVLGRGFSPEDDSPGAETAVWLNHRVWERDFNADPSVIGRLVALAGKPARIAGVMPDRFGFPKKAQLWTNMKNPGSGQGIVRIVGRLRDGVSQEAAQAEFETMGARLAAEGIIGEGRKLGVYPYGLGDSGTLGILLLAMLGIVGGVLGLACINVANLWTARGLRRGHELAVRSALGASRWRIVRQMLLESTMLAALGACGGLLIAAWATAVLDSRIAGDPDAPFWIEIGLDWTVFAATAALTLLVGAASGLAPALRSARIQPGAALKENGGGPGGLRLGFINRSLVTLQIGLACTLLILTGALVDGIRQLSVIESAYDPAATLSAKAMFGGLPQFDDPARRRQIAGNLIDAVRALPGVKAAAAADRHPTEWAQPIGIETSDRQTERPPQVSGNDVAPGYFRDLQIPLLQGREFTAADTAGSEPVAVVNASFARRFWPNAQVVGQVFRTVMARAEPSHWITVAGVVPDQPMQGPMSSSEDPAGFYLPLAQGEAWSLALLVRAAGDPYALAPSLERLISEVAAGVPVDNIMTVADRNELELSTPRALGGLAGAFGLSALLLAAVGIFAIAAFSVERRTREFGVRLALGATRRDLMGLVFRQSAWQLAIGLGGGFALGGGLSMALARQLTRLLPEGSNVPYATVAATIVLSLAIALWLPARRAARVDPMTALRTE